MKPTWAEGWWSLGTIEYDRNVYREAAQAFGKLVALAAEIGNRRVMLGLSQFELGMEDDRARVRLQEGRRLGVSADPQFREVMLYHEGVLLQRKGRFEAAQEILGQMCRQSPYPSEVNLAMGAVALRVAVASCPPRAQRTIRSCDKPAKRRALAAQKKYDEGRQQFDALLAGNPEYPNLHYAYGKFLLDANDNDAAVAQFQAEIKNNPNDAISRLRIASAKYRIDSAAGLPYAEEAVKLDPSLPLGHYLLGLLLLDTDDYLHAISELEMAQKSFSDQPKIYFALASAYSRAGRRDDAARARETFVRLNKEQESKRRGAYSGDIFAADGKPADSAQAISPSNRVCAPTVSALRQLRCGPPCTSRSTCRMPLGQRTSNSFTRLLAPIRNEPGYRWKTRSPPKSWPRSTANGRLR